MVKMHLKISFLILCLLMRSWSKAIAYPKAKWFNVQSSSQQHLPAILRLRHGMQQKLKAEISTVCEPSRRLGIDQKSNTSLLFESNFISTRWVPPLSRDEVNCRIPTPNHRRFTYTPLTWWCGELWIAVVSQSAYAALFCICRHAGSAQNRIRFNISSFL